ncbi:MAG: hypothetical protein KDA28_04705, partial [Phycisphaerales bacterium]|nr:hypothetical protein [Phycisphaerales bacterium]
MTITMIITMIIRTMPSPMGVGRVLVEEARRATVTRAREVRRAEFGVGGHLGLEASIPLGGSVRLDVRRPL